MFVMRFDEDRFIFLSAFKLPAKFSILLFAVMIRFEFEFIAPWFIRLFTFKAISPLAIMLEALSSNVILLLSAIYR